MPHKATDEPEVLILIFDIKLISNVCWDLMALSITQQNECIYLPLKCAYTVHFLTWCMKNPQVSNRQTKTKLTLLLVQKQVKSHDHWALMLTAMCDFTHLWPIDQKTLCDKWATDLQSLFVASFLYIKITIRK